MDIDGIKVVNDDGEEKIFYIVNETKIQGITYYLAADNMLIDDDEEVSEAEDRDEVSEVLIFKEVDSDDEESCLELVSDDDEVENILKVFQELMNE